MMWMMTRSPALFVLLSLSATTTSVTGLSVRETRQQGPGQLTLTDMRDMIGEDLAAAVKDAKEKSELLDEAAEGYNDIADKANEVKNAITEDDKASQASASTFGHHGATPFLLTHPSPFMRRANDGDGRAAPSLGTAFTPLGAASSSSPMVSSAWSGPTRSGTLSHARADQDEDRKANGDGSDPDSNAEPGRQRFPWEHPFWA